MPTFDAAFSPPPDRRSRLLAATGMLEVSVVIGASLAAAVVAQQMWTPGLVDALGMLNGGTPDFLSASVAMAVQLAVQYGSLFVLVALVGWFRHRRRFAAYAIAPSSAKSGAWIHGLVMGLIVSIIPATVFVLQDISPIGQDTPLWAALRRGEWDWTFWFFMAIGSFLVVPIVEEGAWRGYVLGRLAEGYSPGAAVLMTTLLFALLHVQYLRLDAAMALTFVGLLLASLAFGFAVLRTGSLGPAIIAHAILNLPMSTGANIIKVALGLITLLACRKVVGRELGFWWNALWRKDSLSVIPALTVIVATVAAVLSFPALALFVAGALILAFCAIGFLRRSAWAES